MTRIQKAILDSVKSSKQHLSAAQVYTMLLNQFPAISLGTVYRNLNQFADSKLIRRVIKADSADYYEGNINPHDHSVCICCGEMSDIIIPDMKSFIENSVGENIVSFDIVVNIICPKCREKNVTKEDNL